MTDPKLPTLLDLPSEILVHILRNLTTPSFIQTFLTCHQLFDLAAASRDVVLHHLHQVPGIKLGLEDQILSTSALFLILRQRTASSLYGANFHADCEDLRFQNGTLDPTASCLADSTHETNVVLVMKESHVVRHYSTQGTLWHHTPPYIYGDAKPVQVVHWKGHISVLYERLTSRDVACGKCEKHSSFHPDGRIGDAPDENFTDPFIDKKYYMVHYGFDMDGRPDLFQIPTPHGVRAKLRGQQTRYLIPLQVTIHNHLKCAILWGEPVKSHAGASTRYVVNSKSSTSQMILYTCDRRADEDSTLDATVLYPIQRPSNTHNSSSTLSAFQRNFDYLSQYRPRSIAFTDGGRNLKLYRAGSITPYAILQSTLSSRRAPYTHDQGFSRLKNQVRVGAENFKMESPFFGQHIFPPPRRDDETQTRNCCSVYLHLAQAVTDPGFRSSHRSDIDQGEIYIVQNRITTDEEDCEHVIDLHDTGRRPYDEARVVARLWGWNSSLLANSTLTAMDSVCVSPKGTRIAIACWDRILVWPLHPEIFCEEWVSEERRESSDIDAISVVSDDSTPGDPPIVPLGVTVGNGNADNAGDDDDDAASSTSNETDAAAGNFESNGQPAMVKATKFYDLVKYPSLGEIVELKPVVLKLPGGAVARKMMWSSTDNESFDEPTYVCYDDLSDVQDYNADRRSVRSSDSETSHVGDGRWLRGNEEVENDTIIPVRLTEEDDLDQGRGLTAEEVRELESIGTELETLVEDNLRTEPSVPPARVGDSSPEELRDQKLDDEATQAGSEATPPFDHEILDAGMNDAPLTPTASEDKTWSCMPQPAPQDSPADEKQVQLYDGHTSPPPIFDNSQINTLDFNTGDTTDVLENFDFDSFLNTATDESFTFANVLDSHPAESVAENISAAPGSSSAPYDLLSRPPSPLESRNQQWRGSVCVRQRSGCKRKPKRKSEDELVVMTDKGVQVWNLGVWGRGRREREWLDEKLS